MPGTTGCRECLLPITTVSAFASLVGAVGYVAVGYVVSGSTESESAVREVSQHAEN